MFLPLLLSSLHHNSTATVYTITPSTTCHHCHNLQYYLLNTTMYFTSNSRPFFLPGLHHLNTYLIIQNVQNISLIGSTTNSKTPDTIIQYGTYTIIVANSTRITVASITFENMITQIRSFLNIINSAHIHLKCLASMNKGLIKVVNIFGSSLISDINNTVLHIRYDDNDVTAKSTNHLLIVQNYTTTGMSILLPTIYIQLLQVSYKVIINITDSTFISCHNAFLEISSSSCGHRRNIISVKNCMLLSNIQQVDT